MCARVHLLHSTKWRNGIHRLERIIGYTLIDAREKLSILVHGSISILIDICPPHCGGVGPVANLAAVIKDNDDDRNRAFIHCPQISRNDLVIDDVIVIVDIVNIDVVRGRVVHGRGIHSGSK